MKSQRGFWKDRRVLVTGTAGFLGRRLAQRLLELGANVTGFDITNESVMRGLRVPTGRFSQAKGDIRDTRILRSLMNEKEIETVFHLAAQSIVERANENPSGAFDTNVRGTWMILDFCRKSSSVQQVVHASSDHVYGDCTSGVASEDAIFRSLYPYDVSKVCSDLIARSYAATYGLRVAITRCSNLYGEGDLNWTRVIPGTIRSVLKGKRPVIRSDGRFVRDYLYIEDGLEAYVTLAEKLARDNRLAGEAFNISGENHLTVIVMVQRILDLMKSDLRPVVLNQASNEIRNLRISSAKARRLLGWKPRFTLEQGLQRTITFYKKHLSDKR